MNLIDAWVTKIIEKKKYKADESWGKSKGKAFDIFVVEYNDMGGNGVTELWFEESEHKNIDIGYKFTH